ncbi:hypothetical protein AVEN_82652-1 [Araneus ventricosus]|uniref:Uncharacterized protein n=1 Tax=Araneus ventricosus TaxID=182803 RepID=A0A4Y2KW37_ARAVE|nr:hypothetical protein AVEN_82652-1 [Araneus ventricosus]
MSKSHIATLVTLDNFRHRKSQLSKKRYPVPMAQGFVGWLQHSGETSGKDRKVKGIGLDRDVSSIPTGSCNCVCVLGIRPPAVRLVELRRQ